jgi:hypothetical protein
VPQHAVLTDVSLRAAKPPENGAVTLWDGALKHFGVRIRGGAKSFIVLLGSGRRQVIGRFPTISLSQARTKAKMLLAERTLGRHQPKSTSWDTALPTFLALCEKKNRTRTHSEYARTLKSYFPFGATKLCDITRQDISKKLDKLANVPSQQAHAFVVAKIFFRWALAQGYIDTNPTGGLTPRHAPTRARVLTDKELEAVWKASQQIGGHFGSIVKLLILTGQRRGEIAALQFSWIQNNTITLPSELTKNAREHSFPIGPLSASIIPIPGVHSGLLFPARGNETSPFNGWSKSKVLPAA